MARIAQREFPKENSYFCCAIRWLLSFFAAQSAGWGLGGILPRNSRIPQSRIPRDCFGRFAPPK